MRLLRFLFAAFVVVLLVGVAGAQEAPAPPTRAFGGCSKDGSLCAGPSAVAGLVAYSFRTREFTTGIMAGACYGAQAWANRWYTLGLDACANIQTGGTQATTALFSMPVSFAEYVRVGPAVRVLGTDREWMVVGALGLNFK